MDPFESIKATFFQECDELLTDAEQGLLAMEGGDADAETINAVFRAVHSVKGGAGAFGLDDLVRFAHVFETTLDEVRAGRLPPSDPVVKALLRAADILADLVRAARDGGEVDQSRCDASAAELSALTGIEEPAEGDDGMGEIDRHAIGLRIGLDEAGIAGRLDTGLQRVLRLRVAGRALEGLQLADDDAVPVDDRRALAAPGRRLPGLLLAPGLFRLGRFHQRSAMVAGSGMRHAGGKNGHAKAGRADGSK